LNLGKRQRPFREVLEPDQKKKAKLDPRRLRRALVFARPYRWKVITILGITLFVAAINAAEPLIMKYIIDSLSAGPKRSPLVNGILLLIGLGLVREIATAGSNWLTWHTRLGIHYELLGATVERLHRLPLSFHRREGVGAVMTRLDRGIQGFINAVTQILFNVFPAILYLGIAIFIMFRLDWRLACAILFFAPIPALIAAFAAPEQTRRDRALLDQWSSIYSRFNEVLSGIVTVRSFTMEDREKHRFLTEVSKANEIVVQGVAVDTGFGAATNVVVTLARLAAVALGGWLVIRGEQSVGTLVAFLGYVSGLFGPVQGLSGIYQTVQRASVSLDEVFSILDVQDTLGDAPNAIDLPSPVRGEVVFRNVHFSYEQTKRPVLHGIDLKVEAGETIAIVGPSGSGKTTLMGLLMRFYDPDEGIVSVGGHDLRTIKQKSLRENIGVVLQEPLLFNDTVRNNIAYGRPEATEAEIENAARAANACDFIQRMPDGFDTMVGERGGRLSVGERQRVTIARALLKNPPVLILDEATASLDAESEALVQEALDRLMHERTTFVIAHRLATVVRADKIIVLKDGIIAESGTHLELIRRDGYFASLVERQTRGLIANEAERSAGFDVM
jgi:ATP-binding cassette, subfamily B, bacterial